MKLALDYIQSCVNDLAAKIDVPNNLLPSYGKSGYGPTNYIRVDEKGNLTYVIPGDRGDDICIEAIDLDHLLYIIFRNITSLMASNLAAIKSKADVDNRRQQNQLQLELLGKLNEQWKQKEQKIQEGLEIVNPFNDYEGQRRVYFRNLLASGFLHDEAMKKTNDKYP